MILVAGSANLDFVVQAPRIPGPGETVLGRDFRTFPGGKGANQAIACARAGADTTMLLALGNDAFATPLEQSLRDAGVRLHIVRSPDRATGTAFICVSDDAENAITVAPGANAALQATDLPPLAGITHLLLQLETPLDVVHAYAKAARAASVKVVLNAAPAQALPPALLAALDILIVNGGEAATLCPGKSGVEERLASLDVPCVIVTLGEGGCVARPGGELVKEPGFAVKAIDTTAAGDTFCGALVACLGRGTALREALRFANAAAALACTRLGAQSSIPMRSEVDSFLQRATAPTP